MKDSRTLAIRFIFELPFHKIPRSFIGVKKYGLGYILGDFYAGRLTTSSEFFLNNLALPKLGRSVIEIVFTSCAKEVA
jgi:hypothetical protein